MQVRLMEPQTATQSSDQKFWENPKQPALVRSKFQARPTKLEEGKTWRRIPGLSLVSTESGSPWD